LKLIKAMKWNKNLWFMVGGDIVVLAASHVLAYLLRFEFSLSSFDISILKRSIIPSVGCKLIFFYWFKLYRGMWRYTSIADLINIIKATGVSTMTIMAAILILYRFQGYPRSVFLIDAVLTLIFISGFRLGVRLFFATSPNPLNIFRKDSEEKGRRLLIIGAGDAGEKMLREIRDNARLKYDIVGFLDDDPNKVGRLIHGVPVLGLVAEAKEIVSREKVEEILIAISSATGKDMKRIVEVCKQTKIRYKTIPGIGELIDGRVTVKSIRDVSYEDLLGREPVRLEKEKIGQYLEGKRVLITGAGGSIGSELCRQIARYNPASLILLDRTEKNLYDLEMDMWRHFLYIKYVPVLGDIRHKGEIKAIFEKYGPEVVFHAAAYKHVPMLEINPWEAIYNNILGSKNVLEIAHDSGLERFVLVSTDKAVNPTNVMGASKRVTELIMQAHVNSGPTKLMAVRFGNVVGSSGSVIPLFKKQIELGGPVTVTHPEVTRYFMTIPEAAQLILQAGTMGKGGEIFVLDMGTPVKIVDLARDLIRLSGFEPERDVEIKFIGLRLGEKLYEELIVVGEEIAPTSHDKILILNHSGPSQLEKNELEENICELVKLAEARDAAGIKNKLKEMVPEYQPFERRKREKIRGQT
jgi:FlaA1/EpsC-like NDP-sugar epimerase